MFYRDTCIINLINICIYKYKCKYIHIYYYTFRREQTQLIICLQTENLVLTNIWFYLILYPNLIHNSDLFLHTFIALSKITGDHKCISTEKIGNLILPVCTRIRTFTPSRKNLADRSAITPVTSGIETHTFRLLSYSVSNYGSRTILIILISIYILLYIVYV